MICSCREFEYRHDTRFTTLKSTNVTLELPTWDLVSEQLKAAGIVESDKWPVAFREILRVPQHLEVYLERFRSTGSGSEFPSYHAMLDDLWNRKIRTEEQRRLIYRLTDYLADKESLWAPLVLFEADTAAIHELESEQILQRQGMQLGFRHQTLLEHARARTFTKSRQSLCDHVVARQDAILVRPTLWMVLSYLREADRDTYNAELQRFANATLRLHIRYLLIDFLGRVRSPNDNEILLLCHWLTTSEELLRVLIAIRGNEHWFHALCRSHFPTVLHLPIQKQWPIIGVITAAWGFARAECLKLINDNWLNDPVKDELTWRALSEIGTWDEEAVDMICKVIERAALKESRVWWAEDLVKVVSADKPELAPRVFAAAVAHDPASSL